MLHRFHVNVGTSWTFEIDESSLVTSLDGPERAAGGDSSHALRQALEAPIDFPSLASASVPGDRIAVAADPLLPDPLAAMRGVVEALLAAGATAEQLVLVLPPTLSGLASAWQSECARADRADVQLAVHDPHDRTSLAYLAATCDGRPIYLNRLLCDADLLVPVTCVPPPASPRWLGIHGSVYPAFSDPAALDRFRRSRGRLAAGQHEQWRKEVDEVGWLLGVCFVVGVVPGRNGTIHQAAAGTPPAVTQRCVGIARAAWQGDLHRRVPLVITLVGGGDLSWDDFAAALSAARQAAGDDAAVVVCGNFHQRPGRSLKRLVNAASLPSVEHRLEGEAHEDTWAAQELVVALQRGPVYFAGGLSDEQVEDLGMAPIGRPEDLARLATRFDECIVISDAQIAAPQLIRQRSSSRRKTEQKSTKETKSSRINEF